jgi:hypothetical protein
MMKTFRKTTIPYRFYITIPNTRFWILNRTSRKGRGRKRLPDCRSGKPHLQVLPSYTRRYRGVLLRQKLFPMDSNITRGTCCTIAGCQRRNKAHNMCEDAKHLVISQPLSENQSSNESTDTGQLPLTKTYKTSSSMGSLHCTNIARAGTGALT